MIGDRRNDENRIVAQMDSIFQRFHNKLMDRIDRAHPDWSNARVFDEAQRLVLLHYFHD